MNRKLLYDWDVLRYLSACPHATQQCLKGAFEDIRQGRARLGPVPKHPGLFFVTACNNMIIVSIDGEEAYVVEVFHYSPGIP